VKKSYNIQFFLQQHQSHIPIALKFSATIQFKFSVKKSFNIQKLLHRKSKRHGTKPHAPHPSLIKSSSKKPRTQSEASRFSGSHNYNTKQNKTKLPSFIDGSLHIKMFDTNMMVTHPLNLAKCYWLYLHYGNSPLWMNLW